jgi:hypothetical protein
VACVPTASPRKLSVIASFRLGGWGVWLYQNTLVVICCTLDGILATMSAWFQLKSLTQCLLAPQE